MGMKRAAVVITLSKDRVMVGQHVLKIFPVKFNEYYISDFMERHMIRGGLATIPVNDNWDLVEYTVTRVY